MSQTEPQETTLFGHPTGLFTLFFAEMWERFSYYGMRALLTLYMIKGFLSFSDESAYRVYGAYTALVYMTPFFGGLLADQILGPKRAVILGGLLMAAGHLMMTQENTLSFYFALGLLICGNGFFKPNISTMIGSLYPKGSPLKDSGFTIFYIGINLGAAAAPLLCSVIGEKYGWHRGFGLATIGMLTGLAVFVVPNFLSQFLLLLASLLTAYSLFGSGLEQPLEQDATHVLINLVIAGLLVLGGVWALIRLERFRSVSAGTRWLGSCLNALLIGGGAGAAAFGMLRLYSHESLLAQLRSDRADFTLYIDLFVTVCLLAAALVAMVSVFRGGLPYHIGEPQNGARLRQRLGGWISYEWAVYLGALVSVPVFVLFVSGFDPQNARATPLSLANFWSPQADAAAPTSSTLWGQIGTVFVNEFGTPAGMCLFVASVGSLIYVLWKMSHLGKVARERMWVALILTFFSLIFWALFEQAGSSLNVFTDRNVDRISRVERVIGPEDVGQTIELEPTQAQLGFRNGDQMFTMTELTRLREASQEVRFTIPWQVAADNVGMGISSRDDETATSKYQAVNPAFILIFGLVFTALWGWMAKRQIEPSTPFKFSLGLLQLGLGYAAFWFGAFSHDERGMVFVGWILLGYLLHTTGELCLSPVGLSMITRLSAKTLVATMMGMWFLATALSQFLASIIAQFTKVETSDGAIPPPVETVMKFGDVYLWLAFLACGSAAVCFMLVPLLKKWMHEKEETDE